jgi:hypothetical protein
MSTIHGGTSGGGGGGGGGDEGERRRKKPTDYDPDYHRKYRAVQKFLHSIKKHFKPSFFLLIG